MIKINIQPEDFDVTSEIKSLRGRAIGAIATFSGIVRENSDSKSLISLTLEHYPGMSEKALDKIARQAMQEWPIESVRIIHRIGRLTPEDNIVFVGCASAHRHAAFDGCRFIMDFLKTDAPFWKAEETKQGTVWVSQRETDTSAKQGWLSGKK